MKKFKLNNASLPKGIKDVKVDNDMIMFGESWTDDKISALRKAIGESGEKMLDMPSTSRKSYEPTDDEKQKILAGMTGVDSLDGFGFFEAVGAETRLDRHKDVLTAGFLEILAKRYEEGRTVVDSHDSRHRIGATFKAFVQADPEDPTESQLVVRFYISPGAKMKGGNSALDEIRQGIVKRMSIGFSYYEYTWVSDEAEGNKYGHSYTIIDVPKDTTEDRIEAYEISTVSMGAQAGARIKGAKTGGKENTPTFGQDEIEFNNSKMENEKILIPVRGAEKEISVAPESKATVEALVAENKELKEREAAARKEIEAEWVKLRKLIDSEVDSEKELQTAKNLPLEFLKSESSKLAKSIEDSQINPNKGGNEDNKDGKTSKVKSLLDYAAE